MSNTRIKTNCVLCQKPLDVGVAMYVKYCELDDHDNGYNSRPQKIKDEFRVVWKGRSSKKIEGAAHMDCWNSVVTGHLEEEKKLKISSKKNRLELVS
jgi:hypothetical protein